MLDSWTVNGSSFQTVGVVELKTRLLKLVVRGGITTQILSILCHTGVCLTKFASFVNDVKAV